MSSYLHFTIENYEEMSEVGEIDCYRVIDQHGHIYGRALHIDDAYALRNRLVEEQYDELRDDGSE